jgi:hypothetical protein
MRNMHHLASGFDSSTRRSEPLMSGTRRERRPRGFPDRIQRVDLEESARSPLWVKSGYLRSVRGKAGLWPKSGRSWARSCLFPDDGSSATPAAANQGVCEPP